MCGLSGASGCRRHVVAGPEPDRLCAAFLLWRDARPADLPERIAYAREPQRLPVVLGADEVVRFLEAVPSLKSRAALTTAYAAGLRASEAVSLKVADIDSSRMVIRVEQGKGGRDRYVMLSPQLLGILRSYWRLARPEHWLFPGRDPRASDRSRRCCMPPAARPAPPRGLEQAGHGPHAAAQLRHPPAGERHRHPHHPGAARPSQRQHHGALYAGRHQHDPRHAQPARPAAGWRWCRRPERGDAPGAGGGGYLPPPRRGVPPRP